MYSKIITEQTTDEKLVLHVRAEDPAEQVGDVGKNPFGTGKVLLMFEPKGKDSAYRAANWRVDGETDGGEAIYIRKDPGAATEGAEAVLTVTRLPELPEAALAGSQPPPKRAPKPKHRR